MQLFLMVLVCISYVMNGDQTIKCFILLYFVFWNNNRRKIWIKECDTEMVQCRVLENDKREGQRLEGKFGGKPERGGKLKNSFSSA